MRGAILGFDLRNAILERLIVWPRFGELIVNSQRELAISLLQIQLRHRFIDERLGRRPGENSILLSLVHSRARRSRPGVQRFLVVGARAGRAGEWRRWRSSLETFSALGNFFRGWSTTQAFGANGLLRVLGSAQPFCSHRLATLGLAVQSFG